MSFYPDSINWKKRRNQSLKIYKSRTPYYVELGYHGYFAIIKLQFKYICYFIKEHKKLQIPEKSQKTLFLEFPLNISYRVKGNNKYFDLLR